ncbi:MAG: hypothetical protein FWG07_01590 [Treponema sp.]|nr:hypothetical protein [Treponema sp.]
MKRLGSLFLVILCLFLSCYDPPPPVKSDPPKVPEQTQPVQQNQNQQPQIPAEPVQPVQIEQIVEAAPESPSPVEYFDPASITQEERDTAKIEIQQLIQRLNGIIRAKNYNAWVTYLDSGYFTTISSKDFLDRVSQSTVLVRQKIVLKSAQDYFNHVVVPSRANDHVDDIEFVSPSRVKAYTVNNTGSRLRLYDLEKAEEGWKIIN